MLQAVDYGSAAGGSGSGASGGEPWFEQGGNSGESDSGEGPAGGAAITVVGGSLFREIREAFGVSSQVFLASLGVRQVASCNRNAILFRMFLVEMQKEWRIAPEKSMILYRKTATYILQFEIIGGVSKTDESLFFYYKRGILSQKRGISY